MNRNSKIIVAVIIGLSIFFVLLKGLENPNKYSPLNTSNKIDLNITNIPIIVHGGLGNKNQILEIIKNYNINGIAIASMFHYHIYNKFDSKKSFEGKPKTITLSE